MATKAPPRFVTNHAAWEYTLAKLAAKELLDGDGNPRNYAAASAIYKRVVAKYGDGLMLELPPVLDADDRRPFIRRADALAMQARAWTVSHNAAWSVGADDAYQRLYFRALLRVARDGNREVLEPLYRFELERHGDDGTHTHALGYDLALWLVRESPDALRFVGRQLADASHALTVVDEQVQAFVEADAVGTIGEYRFDPAYFDALRTRALLAQAREDVDITLYDSAPSRATA
jgi:hypothetical protein